MIIVFFLLEDLLERIFILIFPFFFLIGEKEVWNVGLGWVLRIGMVEIFVETGDGI